MLNTLIKFPICINDRIPILNLNDFQKEQVNKFLEKVDQGEYNYIENQCLCGNKEQILDTVITEKDRYGIPCIILLCKKCGLIRVKERLDDKSTEKFYNNEYRGIYVGKELASKDFFKDQKIRGDKFRKLIEENVGLQSVKDVFEIGCGSGGILSSFAKEGTRVSGCDFGEKYLKFGQNKGLDLYDGEIDPQKTPKNSQDLIIISHVLEHITNPINFINEILEYLKDEKYLLVEVPGIFDIKKTYYNPSLYFQNAHIFNFYKYYLNQFFKILGLKIIYSDERCTLILQKPKNWKISDISNIYDQNMPYWATKIEVELKKQQLLYLLKLNPYYLRASIVSILEKLGLKQTLKKLINK